MLSSNLNFLSPTQKINDSILANKQVELWIKRDDLIHPHISGNKWRKLKYNFQAMKKSNCDALLTFGGAFSNHIAATAVASKIAGVKAIGLIRGEEFKDKLNYTLSLAEKEGMILHFISREEYRSENKDKIIEKLQEKYGSLFVIPEGGANEYGVEGCKEILKEVDKDFDYICAAAGTGTTTAGILESLNKNMHLLAFPVLKGGEGLEKDILAWQKDKEKAAKQLTLISDYHFGGYAKINSDLVKFVNTYYRKHNIPLDLIYTAKMMYGIYDLVQKDFFPKGSKILFYHSGGLQGNKGIRERLNINLIF